MEITMDMTRGSYRILKSVYEGRMSRTQGKEEIHKTTGMNASSASAIITIFLAMMEGEVYKRAFNNASNLYLLENIRNDYGEEAFNKALSAAQQHINYYSTLGKGNLRGYQKIIDDLRKN
ncbi:hypothetical protein ACF3OH_00465 [Chryseomicrobium aureum]|uniref:hypothetical protein n=1 Tax=Chryseomicrobium aureum TaxID=1441723 RepID=UPI00370D733C